MQLPVRGIPVLSAGIYGKLKAACAEAAK